MKPEHKEEIAKLIAKADENLAASKATLGQGYND